MLKPRPFSLEKLFSGSLARIRAEADYFSRLTDHAPELGRINETHLVRLIRAYLPPKFGVGTGFIVSGGPNPLQSPQCDIVLYDAVYNAPLYSSEAWTLFPIEMVHGVIEVKTTLNADSLGDAMEKCAAIRGMVRTKDGKLNKAYISQDSAPSRTAEFETYYDGLAPRFFVFAYDGWQTMPALERNFAALSDLHPAAHIHGICSLTARDSMWVAHRAYKTGPERIASSPTNGFRHFLMWLPRTLDSMLPQRRTGIGFDAADLNHYEVALRSGAIPDSAQQRPTGKRKARAR